MESLSVFSDFKNKARSSETEGVSKSESRRLDSETDRLSLSIGTAISIGSLKRTRLGPKSSSSCTNFDFCNMSVSVSPPVGCDSRMAITW